MGTYLKMVSITQTDEPGIRINCAAPNKETGNGTNSGDWIFGEDGILTIALFVGEESIAMACRKVSINMTCAVLTMQKCIWDVSSSKVQAYHETIENNVYRLCTELYNYLRKSVRLVLCEIRWRDYFQIGEWSAHCLWQLWILYPKRWFKHILHVDRLG